MPAQTSLKAGIASSAASRKYMTSYRRSETSPCSPPVSWPGRGSVNTGPSTSVGSGHRPPIRHVEQHVEEQQEPGPAGIDHPRLLEHGQHLRGPGQRIGALRTGRLQHGDQVAAVLRRHHRGLRGLAHHRQDGALDGPHDRLVGSRGGGGQRLRTARGVEPVVGGHHARDAAEDLREDHPRVAAGPHEGAVADRLAHRGQVAVDAGELLAHRGQREGHVRARVAVRHGIDVELVEAGAVGVEGVPIAEHHRAQILGAEARQRRHRRGY